MPSDGRLSDFEVDVQKWKERNFPRGSPARATFEHLCLLGCDQRGLLSFLSVAVVASQSPSSIYDTYRVTRSALIGIPRKLEKLSGELDTIDLLLGHCIESFFIQNADLSDEVRSHYRKKRVVYQRIPGLLRALAIDIRLSTQLLTGVGPKKYDTFRHFVLDLLRYVDSCTKSPHYQEVADLLAHMCSLNQKFLQGFAKSLPKSKGMKARERPGPPKLLTSPDALKALYNRSAKYGFCKD